MLDSDPKMIALFSDWNGPELGSDVWGQCEQSKAISFLDAAEIDKGKGELSGSSLNAFDIRN